MPKHENKKCQRCNKIFECKLGNVLECQCTQIVLTDEAQNYVSQLFNDCLCIDCLHVLRYQFQINKTQ